MRLVYAKQDKEAFQCYQQGIGIFTVTCEGK